VTEEQIAAYKFPQWEHLVYLDLLSIQALDDMMCLNNLEKLKTTKPLEVNWQTEGF